MVVCIDTNAALGMFGRAAPLRAMRRGLLAGKFRWALSNEILLEYEAIAAREMGAVGVDRMLRFIDLAEQTRAPLFADCAIAAEADFIITGDRDFEVLRGSGYQPQPVTAEEFIRRHLQDG